MCDKCTQDDRATAMDVADKLAEAVGSGGVIAATQVASKMTERDLKLGLEFIGVVLEVASSSVAAIGRVLAKPTK